jgi:hypothetical protein
MNTQEQFNAAYYAAQPLEIQLALKETDFGMRATHLEDLAARGLTVDRQIMINGYDPFLVMFARRMYGYTWVESINAPDLIDLPPGLFGVSGMRVYNPNPPFPPGSIAVPDPITCDLAVWYPPVVKPLPPVMPKPPAPPAGPYVGELWPDMDVLTGKFGCRHATKAGEKLPVLFETRETGQIMVRGKYVTFATGLQYFVPKDQLAEGEIPPNTTG